MKAKMVPSKTKWGKKIAKAVPRKLLKIYTELLLDGIFGQKVRVK